ncbi:MAG: tyrosine-type recombinase/integrase [Bacilli bacterium]|nr:tyrosine-type recombinase/integrase [Bacilli bacterium]MBQ8659827.1 tyrosine-type recombinase/integrase [Bacilli bacterium]
MEKDDFIKLSYMNNFYEYLLTKNYSENTILSYINDLYYFYLFVKKDLDLVKEEDIRDYLEYLNLKKDKSTSVSRKISTFKSFYKFLYLNEYIDKKEYPLSKISYPKTEKKLPKFIYYNDLLEMINESSKGKEGLRDRLIIEMLYATGVRVSELVNIKINDIDFNNRRIIVCGKGNKERIVYYGEYAMKVLNDYLRGRENINNQYLFLNNRGEKLTDRGVRYIIDNIMKNLSVKTHVTPHVLRHTFATDMLNNGCDIKVVQELLGHSSLKTTEVYTHVTNDRLKEVYYRCFPRRDKDE